MEAKFSNRVKEVISLSREEALRLGHDYIGTEHLLLGMIREGDGVAIELLRKLSVSATDLRDGIEKATQSTASTVMKKASNIPLTRQSEKVLKITYLEAKVLKNNVIGTEHLLLSILKGEDNIATNALNSLNVNYESIKDEIMILNIAEEDTPKADFPNSPPDGDDEDDEAEKGFMGSSGEYFRSIC